MPHVKSSAISQVGYLPRDQRLYVTYRSSGGGYVYLNVPPRKYDLLMRADSKGAFINKQIKPYHKCQRLEDP
jgi:hypothetical protein